MKALIISDIHEDFKHQKKINWNPPVEFDVIILAGDIGNYTDFVCSKVNEIEKVCQKPVIVVAGNHDLWDFNYDNPSPWPEKYTMEQSYNSYRSKIKYFLQKKILEMNGERILGCTFWYNLEGKRQWTDYTHILDHWMIFEEAKEEYEFLEQNLRENDIVVTHMLPSFDVISDQFIGDPDNRYFVRDVTSLIIGRKPKLWISGHSHDRKIKKIGDTIYIRNPRGYPGENPFPYTHIIVDLKNPNQYGSMTECSSEESLVTV